MAQMFYHSDPPSPDPATRLKDNVTAQRDSVLSTGFSYDFGGSVGVKVLQNRPDTDDRTNWMTLQSACFAQVVLGNGSNVGAQLRTEDNTLVDLSFSDGFKVMMAMIAWGQSVMAYSWKLKDQIDAATDPNTLAAIDIYSGWPTGNS